MSYKRDGADYGQAAKRPRVGVPDATPNAAAANPAVLSAVSALLAAAGSNPSNLAAQLTQALVTVAAAAGAPGGAAAGPEASGQQGGGGGRGRWDSVGIPQSCVGWLKGRNGSTIREIENKSGATVEVDQNNAVGNTVMVYFRGSNDAMRKAYGLVVAEVMKVGGAPGSATDCSHLGCSQEFQIDAQYVGWVKGPKGKVVQDITSRSSTRIDVDQKQGGGSATVKVYGTRENVRYARELVAHEIAKVSREASDEIMAGVEDGGDVPGGFERSREREEGELSTDRLLAQQAASGGGRGASDSVVVPSSYVGWLKGRGGAMIKEIEHKSGASVEVDQSTKDTGQCTVHIRGVPDTKRKAYGLVVAEVMKVADQSNSIEEFSSIGSKLEIFIDAQYVGWVKGPRGKVVQDISDRSATRIDVDQGSHGSGNSVAAVKIYGTPEGVEHAKELVAYEIGKVSPEAAAEIMGGAMPPEPAHPRSFSGAHLGSSSSSTAGAADGGRSHGGADQQSYDLTVPSSYVGWLKGRNGAMIRDIEGKSGAVVDVDQSNKDSGFCAVSIRGRSDQKAKAHGLVVAEVLKVADQSGETAQFESLGTKVSLQIDPKYVGWVKGPRGKVIQDISLRSSTRVDVDQRTGDAFVNIYGTHEGVGLAREFIAVELGKMSPEAAAEIRGGAPPLQLGAAAAAAAAPAAGCQDTANLLANMVSLLTGAAGAPAGDQRAPLRAPGARNWS